MFDDDMNDEESLSQGLRINCTTDSFSTLDEVR